MTVEALIRPNTRAIYLESPGSLRFEVQDGPTLSAIERRRGIVTLTDNSWASLFYHKPSRPGVDVSIQAATKYLSGHSDALLRAITTRDESPFRKIEDIAARFGSNAAPDDCYLVLRGFRSLAVRMERHRANALALATWRSGAFIPAREDVEDLIADLEEGLAVLRGE